MNTSSKGISLILIAILLVLSVICANAQVLNESINPQNTGYSEGDLKLPLVYSFDRSVKFSNISSSTSGMGMGMAGGMGMGMGANNGQSGTNIATSRTLVSDNTIIVSSSSKIFAYEKTKGRLIWSYPSDKDIDNGIASYPAVDSGKVYFINSKNLYCLSEETGKAIWVRQIPDTTSTMIIVVKDTIYLPCGDGKIYRINTADGYDIDTPLSINGLNLSNGFAVKDNLLVTKTATNAVYGIDLTTDKPVIAINLESAIRGFLPIITDNNIILSNDKEVVVYKLDSGKEYSRQAFATPITSQPATDGKSLYVSCANQKLYALDITKPKITQRWKKPFQIGQTINQIVMLQDNVVLAASSGGTLFAIDNKTGEISWDTQLGKIKNNSTFSIPGYTTASNSYTRTSATTAANTIATTINGQFEDIDIKSLQSNYVKEFNSLSIVGNVSYSNGVLACITDDGSLLVRTNINANDNKAPEIMNYYPGYDSTSKKISAIPPIYLKITASDKGSGLDVMSAKLSCTDQSGEKYDVKLVFDMKNQLFYGILNKPKTNVITPFPNGTFKANFTVNDYSGNTCKFDFTFDVDSSIESVKTIPDTSSKYIDVNTGGVYDGSLNDLMKESGDTAKSNAGGAVNKLASNNQNNSSTNVVPKTNVANRTSAGDDYRDNTPEGVSLDVVEVVDDSDDGPVDVDYSVGPPPNPPFAN